MASRRGSTDYGTVLLHALMVAAFAITLATGLRIATDDPEWAWLLMLDPLLPGENLWFNHLVAGTALAAMLATYFVYVRRARLQGRTRLDRARLAAILQPGARRWAGLNTVLFWVFMAALLAETLTGVLLFFGAGRAVLDIHIEAAFATLVCALLHVVLHVVHRGWRQLLRIVVPGPLAIPPEPPDLAELLAEEIARKKRSVTRIPHDPRRQAELRAHPLASALSAGLVVLGLAIGAERVSRPDLIVTRIAPGEAPRLDGDLSDAVWTKAKPVQVLTTQGGDFGGSMQSLVEVRALHDGEFAYFAFVWEDPTRSLKHLPLVKQGGRWFVAASRGDLADEHTYNEDKFSVLLSRPGLPLIGGAIHLGRRPVASQPASVTGRGLHFTTDNGIADVWLWRASHAGPNGHVDNSHFGGPREDSQMRRGPFDAYAGGFALDPGPVPYRTNIHPKMAVREDGAVVPLRLPKDIDATARAMGRLSDNANESESEGARWWMTQSQSVAYTPEQDAAIPDGTVIPGILMADELPVTATSIRGAARWAAGRWTLELSRRLDTGGEFDIPIRTGVLMWVAAFDHAAKRHTRHLRPLRLEVK